MLKTFKITKDIIKVAIQSKGPRCQNCPVAQVLKPLFPSVSVGITSYGMVPGATKRYRLPKEVSEFIEKYDNFTNKSLLPELEFTLDL